MVKESACQYRRHRRHGFEPCVRKIPWSRKWSPTLVFLPRKLHGQEKLAGYSPRGHKGLDMTEQACTSKTMTLEELKQFLPSLYKYQCIIMK